MSLHFSRNTKVYIEQSGKFWEIPVLDGFSFSQATNASEITLNEMSDASGVSRRARQMFNDSYAPAEWSFASYIRPNIGGFVEEPLWANFVANNSYSSGWAAGVTTSSGVAASEISFSSSNVTALGTFNLYFVMGAATVTGADFVSNSSVSVYKIEDCVVNEASIDFDIDGIAMINWSGFGKIISEAASLSASAALIPNNTSSTTNFIRNRLTSLEAISAANSLSTEQITYNITLTGGNITFTNNITYLTPETLGVVNQPIGHVTGTRAVTGNFTCYLGTGTDESADLFQDIIGATDLVTNDFSLTFSIGGSSGTPRVDVALPKCHLEVPTHSIDDVISLETNFHALPSTIDSADEATVTYTGAA